MFSYPGRRTTYYYECFFERPPGSVQSRVFETVDIQAIEEQQAAEMEERKYENNGGYLRRPVKVKGSADITDPKAIAKMEMDRAF